MRKIYENAEIEIIVMNGEDVLTSSSDLGDQGNVGDLGGLE
jgi:hypothetical protein